DHGLAQGMALVAFLVHLVHIGPKKVLSTVCVVAPSSLRIVKTTSWRPVTEAGALSTTGSESTSSACAPIGCAIERRTMPGVLDSTSTVNARAWPALLTSLSV